MAGCDVSLVGLEVELFLGEEVGEGVERGCLVKNSALAAALGWCTGSVQVIVAIAGGGADIVLEVAMPLLVQIRRSQPVAQLVCVCRFVSVVPCFPGGSTAAWRRRVRDREGGWVQ